MLSNDSTIRKVAKLEPWAKGSNQVKFLDAGARKATHPIVLPSEATETNLQPSTAKEDPQRAEPNKESESLRREKPLNDEEDHRPSLENVRIQEKHELRQIQKRQRRSQARSDPFTDDFAEPMAKFRQDRTSSTDKGDTTEGQ